MVVDRAHISGPVWHQADGGILAQQTSAVSDANAIDTTGDSRQIWVDFPKVPFTIPEINPYRIIDDMETHIPVFEWLRQCSKDGNITAEFGAINVTESKGAGRIVLAGRNIKDGERIVTIPLNCLMTSRDAKKCQLAREIKKSHATIHSEHTWLAVYLMEESRKGNTSRYWGYISSLPKSFESMPIFFSKELKAHLQGSIALSKITSMKKDLRRDFEEISEKVPGFAKYDYKEFEWSRLCVWTRVFSIELGGKEIDALVPIADMFNHSPQPQISWYFCDEEKAFCMTCEQDVPKGAQIFDSYGRKSMSRYFVNYGFTVGGNYTFNEAVIDVPLRMKGDRKCKGKHTKYADISPRGKGGKYTITTSLASFQKLSQRIQPERMFSKSIEGEIRLLLTIEKACKHALKRFPHSLRYDHALLKKNEFRDPNVRNAVVMRCSEKEVLHWYIGFCTTMRHIYMRWSESNPSKSSNSVSDMVAGARSVESYRDYVDCVLDSLLTSLSDPKS